MIELTHGNKCPKCGKEFEAEGNLIPNTKDREFYGGRIKYFKRVVCDCDTRYILLIGKKDTPRGELEYPVIDMALDNKDADIKTLETEKQNMEQKVLAAMVDVKAKMNKLEELTTNEIKKHLTDRGIAFTSRETKQELIRKLLEKDPNVVVAQNI